MSLLQLLTWSGAVSPALSCCLTWLPHESFRTNCMPHTPHVKFLAGGRASRLPPPLPRREDEEEGDDEEEERMTGSNFRGRSLSAAAESDFPRRLLPAFVLDLL